MCVSARSYYFDIWSRYSANDVAKYNHVLSTHSGRVAGAGQFAHSQLFIVQKCRDLMLVVIVHYVFRALSAIIGDTTSVIFQNTRRVTALTCHSAYQTRSLNWFNCHFYTHGRNLLLFANIQWSQCNYCYFFPLSRVCHIFVRSSELDSNPTLLEQLKLYLDGVQITFLFILISVLKLLLMNLPILCVMIYKQPSKVHNQSNENK